MYLGWLRVYSRNISEYRELGTVTKLISEWRGATPKNCHGTLCARFWARTIFCVPVGSRGFPSRTVGGFINPSDEGRDDYVLEPLKTILVKSRTLFSVPSLVAHSGIHTRVREVLLSGERLAPNRRLRLEFTHSGSGHVILFISGTLCERGSQRGLVVSTPNSLSLRSQWPQV